MNKYAQSYLFGISVISLLVLSGCGKATLSANPSVGVISDAFASGSEHSSIVLEQKNGYDFGLGDAETKFAFEYVDETAAQGDIQRTFRDMAQNTQTPLVAILGGTSNEATSHAAALANFFNVPMLVPTANGDNLFPSNNLWAFRLSAPGAAYANHLFGSVVTKQAVDEITVTSDTTLSNPELKVAILYEQNTFGESAAVATAEAIMAQSIKIKAYGNFEPRNADPAKLQELADKVQESGVQLVYLISSDPVTAGNLVKTFHDAFDANSMPLLVGQAGGFAATDFLNKKEAEGVYVLRQQIDRSNCPAAIQSSHDAQTYAAVYLLDQAVQQVNEKPSNSTIQEQREALRDALKQITLKVPCMGMVAFDNAGQNKLLKLEMIRITSGKVRSVSNPDFLEALKTRLAYDLFQ